MISRRFVSLCSERSVGASRGRILMESIEHALEGYAAAVRAKDVDGFVALYADDARVFDMWERWSYDGADALRGMAEEWLGSLGDEQAAVEFDGVQTVVGDEVAVAHAFVTYKRLSAEGTELRAMTNRVTWALQKTAGDRWKIVHEHTSAPTDFETGKVQLKKPASG
jgi:ketosteroid isomerase-like protein